MTYPPFDFESSTGKIDSLGEISAASSWSDSMLEAALPLTGNKK
jgi:hypothetical protein